MILVYDSPVPTFQISDIAPNLDKGKENHLYRHLL